MATIVEDTRDGGVYVLLGAGFGAYKAMKPNWLLGNLLADEESDELSMIAVCDFKGHVGWLHSGHVRVLRVDGRTPQELLLATPDS